MPFADVPAQEPVIVETDVAWDLTVEDLEWEADPHMDLPEGVETYTVNQNEAEGRRDFYIKFPEGYVEPEHTHPAAHASLLVDGTMTVHGHTLTPGDYFYGQQVPHGPMEYHCEDAEYGAIVFVSFVGGSPSHDYEEE